MSFIELKESAYEERTTALLHYLTYIWEQSVKATHLFLSAEEISEIKPYVIRVLREIPCLVIAKDEDGFIIGFMGVENDKLEMLFISPDSRGKGIGKALIQYGIETFSINEVTVNEQNPQAIGFYEHMGFEVNKRTDLDEQGRPYPLLYMRRWVPVYLGVW